MPKMLILTVITDKKGKKLFLTVITDEILEILILTVVTDKNAKNVDFGGYN